MSKPFNITIDNGVAEMILDHPPVNAFDSAGWFAIAAQIDALGVDGAGGGSWQNRGREQGQL